MNPVIVSIFGLVAGIGILIFALRYPTIMARWRYGRWKKDIQSNKSHWKDFITHLKREKK